MCVFVYNGYLASYSHSHLHRQKQSIRNLQMQLKENESRYLILMNEVHWKNITQPSTETKVYILLTNKYVHCIL